MNKHKYKAQVAGRTIYFKSFDAGQAYCSQYYRKNGVVLAMREAGFK
jgi:hypothetical protein